MHVSRMPQIRRWLLVGSTMALTMALAMLLTAARPGVAHAASFKFVPERLIAYDIEDPWPDVYDEIRANYGNQTYATTIRQGSTATDLPAVDFTGSQLQVDLWERDGGWYNSNHLGTVTISSAFPGEELSADFAGADGIFNNNTWHYHLVYKVIAN